MNDAELRRLQMTELDILRKVDEICHNNGIKYYMVGGTLLGAIRHKGFIPWDDDLDIAMPRKDYNRFIKLCISGALGEEYYLHHTVTDKEYWAPFAKVKKNGTVFAEPALSNIECHKGIFIDIFPLDYSKKNHGLGYHIKAKMIKKLSYIIIRRRVKSSQESIVNRFLLLISKLFKIRTLANLRDFLCSRTKQGDYFVNYGSNYKYTKQTMKKEIYGSGVKVQFEDMLANAPSEYGKYLSKLFGKWKNLPPENERRNHNPAFVSFEEK